MSSGPKTPRKRGAISSGPCCESRRAHRREIEIHGHRGNSSRARARKAGHPGFRDRPGRIHRAAAQRAAVSHHDAGDAPDAHRISRRCSRKNWAESTRTIRSIWWPRRGSALRKAFFSAEMGITGANFLVADSGMVAITTNEGNARSGHQPAAHSRGGRGNRKNYSAHGRSRDSSGQCSRVPAPGQSITCYNTLVGGPRTRERIDGPEEFHVVLLDNGRTELLADPEQRDVLHCIRCGACLNACPIFRNVGGHTYGTTYQGPIGSVLTPHLRGLDEFQHLSFASSLCGACTEACPVKIDLHHHLLHNRRNAVRTRRTGSGASASAFKAVALEHDRARGASRFLGCGRTPRLRIAVRARAGRHAARSVARVDESSRRAADSDGIVSRAVEGAAMAQTENPGRERILARIRDGAENAGAIHGHAEADVTAVQPIFAPIPDALERFRRSARGTTPELIVTPNARASGAALEIRAGIVAGRRNIRAGCAGPARDVACGWRGSHDSLVERRRAA